MSNASTTRSPKDSMAKVSMPEVSIPKVSISFQALRYAFLILALSVFLMHGWGILWAAFVLLFWGSVYVCRPNSMLPKVVLFLSFVAWPIGFLFWGPPLLVMSDSDPTGRYNVCNDIRQVTLAVYNYESAHGHLPPASMTDSQGRPMHSWRILVLPLLGSEDGEEIFRKYKMDQPWDSPHNLSVAQLMHEPLYGDNDDPTMATYKLVSGPGTPFGVNTKSRLPRGRSKQIMVVEDIGSPVLWTQPDDLTPQQVVAIFDANANPDGLLKKSGEKWSNIYTRKSWFGMLDCSTEKARPLSDPTKLLDFCLVDRSPEGEIEDLAVGNVDLVERRGSSDRWVASLATLALLALMCLPAWGERRRLFSGLGLSIFCAGITAITFPFFLAIFNS